ncbi:alpha-glucosidase [Hahella ganghwensis]|uniref:alpha-glucosidase n=1 Tax=Hahella ganghwensis TaxID=286420 RepID=UPI00037006F2|nr:alpha-glucosidase [Hahella ganghwensis]
MQVDRDWWRGAVIYQVYPRSFFDSNGDGIGDLPGVTAKMDYIASLNVDAVWLSPFFTSPMKDFGYDVSDYRNVDPIFGTLSDFDDLIAEAHKRGIKIIIDQVLSHTSDQHAWFVESRSSRDNPKADWYVWAEPKADGTPPNNWLSVFGGSAWAWDSRRRQYYLHNFLTSQPDLNFHSPEVAEQILSDVEFWLKRGVDGFRLDAINFCYHDKKLRDNPPNEEIAEGSIGVRKENPYAYQSHRFDKTQPENLAFLKKVRALLEKYPGTTTVGEIGDDNSLDTMAAYTSNGDKLHMAYSFDFLTEQCNADFLRTTIETIETKLNDGWPCWAIGNHDVSRVATRWSDGSYSRERNLVYMAMLLTLRGSVCIYQGEELGLEEAELAYEDLVDPYGIAFWPEYKGRDGCRTPMPWNSDTAHAGFTDGTPWLPLYKGHIEASVEQQDSDPESMLNAYRNFLAWRRTQEVLLKGEIEFHKSGKNTLVFERNYDGKRMLVALNISDKPVAVKVPPVSDAAGEDLAIVNADWSSGKVHLPPYGIGLAWLAD